MTMTIGTREIPKEEWAAYLESFSRRHLGRVVNLERIGPDLGRQLEACEIGFQGIHLELRGSEAGTVEIATGDSPDEVTRHAVDLPSHVWVKQREDGSEETLEIETDDGEKVLLRFVDLAQLPDESDVTVTLPPA